MLQDGVQTMVKKLTRGQRAWVTRKTKRRKKIATIDPWSIVSESELTNLQSLKATQESLNRMHASAPILTLCGQLEDAIMLLETRVSNAIAKINSLM